MSQETVTQWAATLSAFAAAATPFVLWIRKILGDRATRKAQERDVELRAVADQEAKREAAHVLQVAERDRRIAALEADVARVRKEAEAREEELLEQLLGVYRESHRKLEQMQDRILRAKDHRSEPPPAPSSRQPSNAPPRRTG